MPEIQGIDKLVSYSPAKRVGKHREYGRSMFAFSEFGDEHLYFVNYPYGSAVFGDTPFGFHLIFTGIFRRDNVTGEVKYYREPYYVPKNPRTGPQQTNRQKLANGVAAWQALTSEQKNTYNKKAIGKGMSGYNLFLREYLLSH